MPNNTQNILVMMGEPETLKRIYDLVLTRDEYGHMNFDFQKITPMPEDLQVTSGSQGDEAYACLHGSEKDLDYYRNMKWMPDDCKTREEITAFLEDRASKCHREGETTWRELGDRYASNIKKYGYKTWYSWACDNWGTKWNAYNTKTEDDDPDCGRLVIEFQTAWSAPLPIYEKLKELFPDVEFEAYWSDEGSYERSLVYSG